MCADNWLGWLSVFTECTTDVRQWYLQNGLQLNWPRQVKSCSCCNCQWAVCVNVIRISCVRVRSWPASSRREIIVLGSCSISVWCSTNACGQWHNCAITVHTFSSCWLQNCKVALLTFKVHSMLMPSYLCRLIQYRQRGHNMQSVAMMSTCHKCAYQCSALAVKWPNYEVTIHQTSFNYILW